MCTRANGSQKQSIPEEIEQASSEAFMYHSDELWVQEEETNESAEALGGVLPP
jgi:hypothetical protein